MQNGDAIRVEFFGPFREDGSSLSLQLRLIGSIGLMDLCDHLERILGAAFRDLEARDDVVCILNDRVIERSRRHEVSVRPGDRLAYALGMEDR